MDEMGKFMEVETWLVGVPLILGATDLPGDNYLLIIVQT